MRIRQRRLVEERLLDLLPVPHPDMHDDTAHGGKGEPVRDGKVRREENGLRRLPLGVIEGEVRAQNRRHVKLGVGRVEEAR